MTGNNSHLDGLENQSVFILREANHGFQNKAMPWSMGKDSNVLLWLALKAFFGQIPFPLLHIDTTYEFPEMLEFRDWAAAQYGIRLIVKVNTEARARGVGYERHDPVTVTHELKTIALKQAIAEHGWDALITGIRRDEDPTRAKAPSATALELIDAEPQMDVVNQMAATLNGAALTTRCYLPPCQVICRP